MNDLFWHPASQAHQINHCRAEQVPIHKVATAAYQPRLTVDGDDTVHRYLRFSSLNIAAFARRF